MKMMIYLITFLLLIISTYVSANGRKECLTFHVIANEPIGYIGDNNLPTGVHWEYLKAVETYSNLCINMELFPYARIWESIKQGKHDGGIIFKSASRSPLVTYATHIQTKQTVVIPALDKKIDIYEDLKGLTIGAMRGAHLSKRFDQDKSLNILRVSSYKQMIKMLKRGRIDAIAGGQFILLYQLAKYETLDKVNLNSQLTLGLKEQWLQFSNKSKQLDKIPLLQKSIKHLKESGAFRKILIKYYGNEIDILPDGPKAD